MVLKIKFGALLTMCGEPLENGELVIEDGEILEVFAKVDSAETEETLDLSDYLLMPGFVNAHSHLGLTALAKRISPSRNFAEWIRELIPLNSAMKDEERMQGIGVGADEMMSSGVTGLADYVADSTLLNPISRLGFRNVLFLEVIGFQSEKAETIAREVERILIDNSSICSLGIAPHAPYSVSAKLWGRLNELAREYDCPLSSHLAEVDEEVAFLDEGKGPLVDLLKDREVFDANWQVPAMTPVRYLNSLGVLNGLIAVHCNYIEDDMEVLKAAGAGVVFCPKSTHWFGRTHILPARKMLDIGIPVALGTDSMSSNDSLNFLEELRMADKLLPDVSRKEILIMATRSGAEILGFPCGKIESGQKADIIGFRINSKPNNWWDVPFEPQRQKVDFYMVNGKVKN